MVLSDELFHNLFVGVDVGMSREGIEQHEARRLRVDMAARADYTTHPAPLSSALAASYILATTLSDKGHTTCTSNGCVFDSIPTPRRVCTRQAYMRVILACQAVSGAAVMTVPLV
mmetsp:Transcript_119971/g.383044  ORF Transcript_119971/g.383044 Transcript_119971/m.383044 type:complete len:115 (-) Transcript_119971:695-1039(-)